MKQLRLAIFVGAISMIAASSPLSAKCAVRSVTQSDGSKASFTAIVPDSRAAEFTALGYQDVDCGQIDKAAHVARLCAPESFGSDGVQTQLEAIAGFPLKKLCDAAQEESGSIGRQAEQVSLKLHHGNRIPSEKSKGSTMVGPLAKAANDGVQAGGN